jgi:hypothetical protein
VGEVKKEVKNMELKNSGKRGWKRRVGLPPIKWIGGAQRVGI